MLPDQTTDLSGEETHRIFCLHTPPAYVKQAAGVELQGDENLPAAVFGDPLHRRFPCHSAGATWLSAAFYYKSGAAKPQIEETIHKAAAHFRILPDVMKLKEVTLKQAATPVLADSDFALVYTDEGVKERRLPIRNAHEVKQATAWLVEHRDQLHFPDRHQVASKILEKSAKFGASLGEHAIAVERMAGLGVCSVKHASAGIRARAKMLIGRMPEAVQVLNDVADAIEKDASVGRDPSRLYKLAMAVDGIDRHAGVTTYSDVLPRVEDLFFPVTVKEASQFIEDHVHLPTGQVYLASDLEHLRTSQLEPICGTTLANALSEDGIHVSLQKMAAVLPKVSREDAVLLTDTFSEFGIHPVETVRSASQQLTPDDLALFASQAIG